MATAPARYGSAAVFRPPVASQDIFGFSEQRPPDKNLRPGDRTGSSGNPIQAYYPRGKAWSAIEPRDPLLPPSGRKACSLP